MIEFKDYELEKEVENTSKKIVNIVNNSIKKLNIDAKCFIAGSVAKKTYLYENIDFDLFVRFEKETDLKLLKTILKETFPKKELKLIHGTRDYYHINYNNFILEFIPTLKVKDPKKAKNSVDVSIYHIKWFLNQLKKQPNLNNEVRITKKFLKANYLYGAESYIKSLSGHCIEILCSYYKTFENLAKNFAKLNKDEKLIIDIETHYDSNEEILNILNRAKLDSPIILIDPILKNRNAAAALSNESFKKLIKLFKQYTKNPKKTYFVKKTKKPTKKNTLIFEFEWLEGNKDIAGSKIQKILKQIKNQLKLNYYEIKKEFWDYSNFAFIELKEYDNFYYIQGPSLKLINAKENFIKKHKEHEVFEKKGYIYAKIKRKINPVQCVKNESFLIKENSKSFNLKYYKNNVLTQELILK